MEFIHLATIDSMARTLAIIATLFYVGRQIRMNSHAIRASAFQSLTSTLVSLNTAIMLDESMAETVTLGIQSQPLTGAQRTKYLVHLAAVIRIVESAYYQVELGVLDGQRLAALVGTSAMHLRSTEGKLFWEHARHRYDAEFRQFVEHLISTTQPMDVASLLATKEPS